MGHYDSSRPGYCGACGAAPGNIVDGVCNICHPETKPDTRLRVNPAAVWPFPTDSKPRKTGKSPLLAAPYGNYKKMTRGQAIDLIDKHCPDGSIPITQAEWVIAAILEAANVPR